MWKRTNLAVCVLLGLVQNEPAAAIFEQPAPFFDALVSQTPPPPIPLAIDGTAQWSTGSSATPSVTVTTTQPNEILLVAIYSLDGVVTSVADTAGLVWVQRAVSQPGTVDGIAEWYAYAPAVVVSDVITVTVGTPILNTIGVAAIVGTSIGNTYDRNASLPAISVGGGGSNASPASTFISTTHANDMLVEFYNSAVPSPLPPSGFTDLGSVGNIGFAYKIVSSPQSNITVTTGSGFVGGIITDALMGQ